MTAMTLLYQFMYASFKPRVWFSTYQKRK